MISYAVGVLLGCLLSTSVSQELSESVSSRAPSDVPSFLPSMAPSAGPTSQPTSSSAPTLTSSQSPTIMASEVPTDQPSLQPSGSPTKTASLQPSAIPSSFPTLECHDIQSYESVINNFSCEDHAGTDCFKWRFLGLTLDQVEQLIVSCPVSCRVECGEVTRIDTEIIFQMDNVPTFLGPETTTIVQDTAVEVLSNILQVGFETDKIFISAAELKKQQILPLRFRSLRGLQGSLVEQAVKSLLVKMVFRGLASEVAEENIEPLLRNAIFGSSLSRALQRSGDLSLIDATISEYVEASEVIGSTTTERTHNKSARKRRVIIPTVLVCTALVGIGVVVYIIRSRQGQTENPGRNIDGSLLNSPAESLRSRLESILSFDSYSLLQSRSFFRATSPKLERSSSTHTDLSAVSPSPSDVSRPEGRTLYENSPVHPLAGIVPPMIVMENIDDQEPEASTSRVSTSHVFPSQRVVAPPELVEELRQKPYSDHATTFGRAFSRTTAEILRSSQSDVESDDMSLGVKPAPSIGDVARPEEAWGSAKELLGRGDMNDGTVSRSESATNVATKNARNLNLFSKPKLRKGWNMARRRSRSFDAKSVRRALTFARPQSLDKETLQQHEKIVEKNTLSFNVSNLGKLGFVLECSEQGCPRVLQVKDYSPLLGKVLPGDEIQGVDGISMKKMSLKEVSIMLGSRSPPRTSNSETLNITVYRSETSGQLSATNNHRQTSSF